jgi:hypothetical protein
MTKRFNTLHNILLIVDTKSLDLCLDLRLFLTATSNKSFNDCVFLFFNDVLLFKELRKMSLEPSLVLII